MPPVPPPPVIGGVSRNIAANFAGSAWLAVATVLAVPVYVHFLGVEAYGVVGFFAVLLALTSLLELGSGAALTRELARLSAHGGAAQEARDLSRSIEVLFWAMAVVAGLVVAASAAWLAGSWLRPGALDTGDVTRSIQLMGVALAIQWPYSMYAGGLTGLQRQVLLNTVSVTGVTVRTMGSIVVLWQVAPTLEAFFVWQIIASAVQTMLGAGAFWRSLPAAPRAGRFSLARLLAVRRFAAGVAGISALAVLLIQMDKVVVSRLLSLEMLGYYMLAGAAASVLYRLASPVFGAVYPRLTQLVALGDEAGAARLYHGSTQLLAILVLPTAMIVAAFPREIILVWTQNAVIADAAAPILRLLVCGTALHALMTLPYALQLAHGWTRLGVYTNAISALLLLPLLVLFVDRFGALGAASVWLLLNLGFFFVNVRVMHGRLLRGHLWRWYGHDIGRPLACALGIVLLARLAVDIGHAPLPVMVLWIAGVWSASAGAALAVAPVVRRRALHALRLRVAL
jgi:O-antigen/teichoic acid export membrane protein